MDLSYSKKYINTLLKDKDNQLCFDCGKKGPQWASINNGIFICLNCAGIHRGLGTSISSVKSVLLDKWEEKHIKLMKIGGNLRLKNLLIEYKIPFNEDIEKKYCLKILDYYRKLLRAEAFNETMPEKPDYTSGLECIENHKNIIDINNNNFISNTNHSNNKINNVNNSNSNNNISNKKEAQNSNKNDNSNNVTEFFNSIGKYFKNIAKAITKKNEPNNHKEKNNKK